MWFFRAVLHFATVAWDLIAGVPGDIANALSALWHFAGSVHSLLVTLAARVLRALASGHLDLTALLVTAIGNLQDAMERIAGWVLRHFIWPLRAFLLGQIAALRKWTAGQLAILRALEWRLYFASLAFTIRQVTIERKARIADVNAARAYALRLVKAALAEVQREAATGYADGSRQRVSVITRLTDELATRNPVVRGLVSDLVTVLLDLIGTENPLARIAIGALLKEVIGKLGVDRVAGDLLGALLGPLLADPRPKNLHDVTRDLARRVSALEGQWARYMEDGGPELDQAGKDWKRYTSLATDAALLGFAALAVADPDRWAAAVADTLGVAVNDTALAVENAIRKAR